MTAAEGTQETRLERTIRILRHGALPNFLQRAIGTNETARGRGLLVSFWLRSVHCRIVMRDETGL